MLTWKHFLPPAVREYVALVRNRRRYPGRAIHSPYIHSQVRLGEECLVNRDVVLEDGVTIGDYTYINRGTIISSGTIGKFCSIAAYCQIGLDKHPLDKLSTSPRVYGPGNILGLPAEWDNFPHPPSIGNDVWIGSAAVILQGVTIGDGAVIAAGAVVTKDVPPYSIVVGVPAQVMRQRFPDDVVNRLVALKWWDLPLHEIRKCVGADDWRA